MLLKSIKRLVTIAVTLTQTNFFLTPQNTSLLDKSKGWRARRVRNYRVRSTRNSPLNGLTVQYHHCESQTTSLWSFYPFSCSSDEWFGSSWFQLFRFPIHFICLRFPINISEFMRAKRDSEQIFQTFVNPELCRLNGSFTNKC